MRTSSKLLLIGAITISIPAALVGSAVVLSVNKYKENHPKPVEQPKKDTSIVSEVVPVEDIKPLQRDTYTVKPVQSVPKVKRDTAVKPTTVDTANGH